MPEATSKTARYTSRFYLKHEFARPGKENTVKYVRGKGKLIVPSLKITIHPACISCEKYKSRQHFTEEMLLEMLARRRCKDCQYPNCSRCGNPLTEVWHRGHGEPLCSDCRGLVPCASCKDLKREDEFPAVTKKQQRNKWKCKDCLQPPCAKCGARRQKPFSAGRRPDGPYYCSKHQPGK